MKILVCHKPSGAFGFISDGWINALRDAGFDAKRWTADVSWHSFDPDLYIGCSGHRQSIPGKSQRGRTKIAIHVNPFGPVQVKPNINESTDAIHWVKTISPDVVFGYGFAKDRELWSYWEEKLGIRWAPMPTAGDATLFKPGSRKDLDFAYIGGYWDYKSQNINTYLLPILDSDLNYKIYGWGQWPRKYKIGFCSDKQKVSVLGRAAVGPCISEPHTTSYGIDIPERVFKVILSGAIAVHDPVADGDKILKSVVWANSAGDYAESVHNLSRESNAVSLKWRNQYEEVISSHTYHHRLSGLLGKLGFSSAANKLIMSVEGHRSGF